MPQDKEKKKQYDREYRLRNREKRKQQHREYYIRNREKIIQYEREYRIRTREKRKKYDGEYNIRNREKRMQYERLRDRVMLRARAKARDNTLLGSKCEKCGSAQNLTRHHPDYLKPLAVITLCRSCNNKEQYTPLPKQARIDQYLQVDQLQGIGNQVFPLASTHS